MQICCDRRNSIETEYRYEHLLMCTLFPVQFLIMYNIFVVEWMILKRTYKGLQPSNGNVFFFSFFMESHQIIHTCSTFTLLIYAHSISINLNSNPSIIRPNQFKLIMSHYLLFPCTDTQKIVSETWKTVQTLVKMYCAHCCWLLQL